MDIALKQRLVGASVLIALAVVVLPMLLGGRPEDGQDRVARIEIEENPDKGAFTTRRFPIGSQEEPAPADSAPAPRIDLPPPRPLPDEAPGPDTAAASGTEAEPVVPPPVNEGEPEPEPGPGLVQTPPEPEPVVEEAPAEPAETVIESSPPQAEPQPAPAATVAGGRYVVQVASFGSVANAEKLSKRLQGLGYAVLTDSVSSDVGTLNRVRVGPYGSESEAGRVVARLREQVEGSKPRVMDLQPGRSERVTEPADPLVRWVVQVGSFSSSANADSLVAKLRLEGLSAYREQVESAGSTIYRVRAGPYVERDEAIRVDRLINDRLALDGVVMSAD
jgi:DedD protein